MSTAVRAERETFEGAGLVFGSRLIVGTGEYRGFEVMREADKD